MLSVNYLIDIVKNCPEYFSDHKILAIVLGVLTLILLLINIIGAISFTADLPNKSSKTLYRLIPFFRIITLALGSVVFFTADQLAGNSDYTSKRFYIEFIIATVVVVLFHSAVLKKINSIADENTTNDTAGQIIEGIIIVIAMAIFAFTKLDTKLTDFGPKLFSKKLGTWIMNGLMSLTISYVLSIIQLIIGFMYGKSLGNTNKQNKR